MVVRKRGSIPNMMPRLGTPNADWVEILSGEGWRILRDLAGEPDRTRSFSPLTLTGAPCWGEAFSAVNRKSCKRSQE